MKQQAIAATRVPEHAIDMRFVARWSPRAFDPTPIPQEHVAMMLEAGRWAPSSMNAQPWRYVVTTDGPGRAAMDAHILPGNRAWSDKAPAIIWVVAKATMGDGAPNRHAWFDVGAATMQIVLQAEQMGYRAHHMGGIDADAAHAELGLDDDHAVICALALGKRGDASGLPDWAQAREAPSDRRPQDDWVDYR